jgi:hypothetical protein
MDMSHRHSFVLALVFSLFAPPVSAQVQTLNRTELKEITVRGRTLAYIDRALQESRIALKTAAPQENRKFLNIAQQIKGKWAVSFGELDQNGSEYLIAYRASRHGLRRRFRVTRFDPPLKGSSGDVSRARALRTALYAASKYPNVWDAVTLPGDEKELLIYLLPLASGPDWRLTFSADGNSLLQADNLHKHRKGFLGAYERGHLSFPIGGCTLGSSPGEYGFEYTCEPQEITVSMEEWYGYPDESITGRPEETDVAYAVMTDSPGLVVVPKGAIYWVHRGGSISKVSGREIEKYVSQYLTLKK